MDNNSANRPDRQKKYRKKQKASGLVRFEIQIDEKIKRQFDLLVNEVANEMPSPWDIRRRQSIARARVFEEITQDVRHDFFNLKDQITALRAEIRAISPNFFISDEDANTPLPEAINSLPNDPQRLKAILAKTYQESQNAKLECSNYKQKSERFSKLYEAFYDYNEELETILKENDIPLPK